MILIATWAAILAALTVAVHTVGFALLWQVIIKPNRGGRYHFWLITRIFIGLSWMLALIHGAAIGIWALFYQWQGILPDAESALYFSGVTYLTIGYGDLVLPSPWRMLAPVEGLMGMLMGGLSASLFFAIAARIHQSRHDETRVPATRYKTSSSRD